MSVENINPYNKYQGNGVTTEFSVDFPYNNKTDVVVYLKNEGEAQQTLVVNTDYTWLNDTTIKTTTAPADGSILAIYRETPAASDYNFENQRRLFPAEVTNSDNLAILLIQELRAMFSRTLTVDETSTVTPEELVDELNSLVITAAGYVSQCSGYSDLAQAWATKTDGPVSGGEYSSKYYAEQILPMASDIASVVGNATNINTVASNISDINSCVSNMSSIQDAPNQAQAAANSAALAQQYGNDKINQTHISNCITEIPQDIKVEIDASYNFIAKAGTKVYFGDNTSATLDSDKSYGASTNFGNEQFVFAIRKSNNALVQATINNVASASTNPATAYTMWFNTTDKKCYINDGSGVASEISFPIALVMHTNGIGWTNVDKVFNGFGYIGMYNFRLPGLKGLVPNGKNTNGTFKNTKWELDTVLVTQCSTATGDFLLIGGNAGLRNQNISTYFEQPNKPTVTSQYNAWYDTENNYIYYTNNTGTTWVKQDVTVLGVEKVTSGKINSLNVKDVFHAVDYNDTKFIGHQAMPSDKSVTLTLPASGQTLTAQADGDFYFQGTLTSIGEKFRFENNTTTLQSQAIAVKDSEYNVCSIRCSKGDVVKVSYDSTISDAVLKFIYTNGSK